MFILDISKAVCSFNFFPKSHTPQRKFNPHNATPTKIKVLVSSSDIFLQILLPTPPPPTPPPPPPPHGGGHARHGYEFKC